MLVELVRDQIKARFDDRLWPDTPRKGSNATPFGIFTLTDATPNNTLDGAKGAFNRYQVDIFDATRKGANAVADLVTADMAAATAFSSVCVMRQEMFEEEVELYRTLLHFSIFKQ